MLVITGDEVDAEHGADKLKRQGMAGTCEGRQDQICWFERSECQ